MRMIALGLIPAGAVLITTLGAQAIEGRYRVAGQLPGSGEYTGQAQLRRTGQTYSVVWQIGASRHVGTGLLTGNVLSVIFQPLEPNVPPGVAAFTVSDGRVVEGTWAGIGTRISGTERWTFEEP